MNTTDLRDLLTERAKSATTAVTPTSADRAASALSRARSLRRCRVAVTGAAVLAVAAIVGAITVPTVLTADGQGPAAPVDMDLPDYAHGGVLIGETTINLPDTETTFTVTPEALPLVIETRCDPSIRVEYAFDNGMKGASPCRRGEPNVETFTEPLPGDHPRIKVGKPLELTITLKAAIVGETVGGPPPEMPRSGSVAVGVYESVPREEYVFPERPAELIDPDELFPGGGESEWREVVESADDPNEPVTVWFDGDAFDLEIKTQTPGIMRVFINGEESAVEHFWDYDGAASFSRGVQSSTDPDREWDPYEGPVDVTLVPEDFTGAWRALITECEIDEDSNGMACGDLDGG